MRTISLNRKTLGIAAGLLLHILSPDQALAKIETNLAFTPAAVPAGKPARATIVVQNSDAIIGTGLGFDLVLPQGLHINGNGNLASNCGGTPSLEEADGRIRLSLVAGHLPAAAGENPGSCSLSFDLKGMRKDTFVMTIPAGTVRASFSGGSQVNGDTAQSSLDVTMSPITINVKSPETATAKGGQIIPHRYIFTNNNDIPITGMDFDVDMSVIANTWRAVGEPIENTCGGSFSISELPPVHNSTQWHGATKVSLRGAVIPARSICTFVYQVTPNRIITSNYMGNGISRRLPADLISTDQGVSNEISNDEWAQFRAGIHSETLINGRAQANLGVLSGEEAELTIKLMNSSVPMVPSLAVPVWIPAAIEVLGTSSNCGDVVTTSSGISWNLDLPGAPPEPTVDFETSSCTASVRVRANAPGNYNVVLSPNFYNGYHIMGSVAKIAASKSPIGVEGGFDKDQIYAADSSIFSVKLTNRSATETLQNVTLSNPVMSRIHGAVIGMNGVTENTCSGAQVSIPADRSGISFTGITLPPSESCILAYQVTIGSGAIDRISSNYIEKINTIGPDDITYRSASGDQMSWESELFDRIGVRMSVEITGWIAPVSASEGSQARMLLNIIRLSDEGHGMRDMGVRLDFADGIVIDSNPNLYSACGGNLLSGPGATVFHLDGAEMPSYASGDRYVCRIEVNVRLPRLAEGETSRFITSTFQADHSLTTRRGFWAQDAHVAGPAGYVPLSYYPTVRVSIARYDLGIGLEFADAAVGGSGTTRMLVSLSNQSNTGLHLSDVGLDIDLSGTGVRLAAVPDPRYRVKSGAANACSGGSFTILPSGLRLSGANINGGAICQVEISVTAGSGGNHIITIPARAVTSNQGVTNPSGVYATLTAASVLSASIGFSPNLVAEGGQVDLIIEIVNTQSKAETGAASALTFAIPDRATPTGAAATSCQGGSAMVSGQNLVLNAGAFPANSSCSISVPITVDGSESYSVALPAGAIRTEGGVTNTAGFTATLRILKAPVMTVLTPPAMSGTGRIGTAVLRLQNPNPPANNPEGLSGLTFEMTPLSEIAFLGTASTSNCQGFSTSSSGGGGLKIFDITLPAGHSCQITLAARAPVHGLHASKAGSISVQQVDLPDASGADLAWRVVADPVVQFLPQGEPPDSEVPFRIAVEIENPNEVPIALGAPGFTIPLPEVPGVMVLGEAAPALVGCGAAALAAPAGGTALGLSGGSLPAGGTCRVEVSLVGPVGGDYSLKPAPLALEYGTVAIDPVTLTLRSTHADLSANRTMHVLARRVDGIEACAAVEEAEPDADHVVPGACIEVTVTVKNPLSEKKTARDITAREVLGDNMALAAVDQGSFDSVVQSARTLVGKLGEIAPGETRSFTYRAVLH